MARNRSEQIPFPELGADIHRYYKLSAAGHDFSHERSQTWVKMGGSDVTWVRLNWNRHKHKVLMTYYKNLHKAERLEQDKLTKREEK